MRPIPRANTRTHPQRLILHNLIRPILIWRETLTRNLTRITRIVPPQRRRSGNHPLRHRNRLAHGRRLQAGELVGVLFEQICELVHDGCALVAGRVAPGGEGLFGGCDGIVDIGFAGDVDFVGDEGVVVGVVAGLSVKISACLSCD